jgi:predicted metal-dependent enzyme (double-stranded beta helix superfamily)
MFDIERFVDDCRRAVAGDASGKAVREVVARAVADPAGIVKALGEPRLGEVQKIHDGEDVSIINVIWAPRMTIMPHNHKMWAVIGVYTGREDNIFWRRVKGSDDGLIEAAGAESLGPGTVAPLGRDIVHSVTNPLPRCTAAIHVYGGRFFHTPRSEWDPETLTEGEYDLEKNMRLFQEANALNAAA